MSKSKHDNVTMQSTTTSKIGLSKSVMGMKFMKAKSESKSEQAAQKTSTINKTTTMSSTSNDIVIQKDDNISFVQEIFDYLSEFPGRRSFNNFNSSVEKHYNNRIDELNLDNKINTKNSKSTKKSTSSNVPDDEIIQKYEGLVGLPRGPNQSRRKTDEEQHNFNKKNNYDNNKSSSQIDRKRNNNNNNPFDANKYPMKKVR